MSFGSCAVEGGNWSVVAVAERGRGDMMPVSGLNDGPARVLSREGREAGRHRTDIEVKVSGGLR